MHPLPLLLMALMASASPAPEPKAAVAALLDRFHDAAAHADETAYFACFAPDAVFLGTDPAERWDLAAFRAYASPLFAQGRGWTYVPGDRSVALDAAGRVAWFDEILTNAKYGTCRGTGVAVAHDGGWRIAHYSLTFLVPNAKADAVMAVVGTAGQPGEPASSPAPAPRPPHAPPEGAAAHGHAHGHGHEAGGTGGDDATVRHRFDDVEHWVKVFDDPERDSWQKPKEVVAALGLKPGDVVADIGAGTGYFEPHLARAVGDGGTVLAIEVEPSLVEHLRARAEREGLARVVPVLGSFDDPRIPAGLADLVLIVDTYHHVDDRVEYFGRLRRALAPGGRLAVVDFVDKPRPVGPPPEHSLSKEHVVGELGRAGWQLDAAPDLLPWQYVLIFRPATDR